MNRYLLQKIIVLTFFLISFKNFSQYYKLSKQAKVSVLTCGSGNELYSIYGHTGLRFQDVENNLDLVFNYGNFDFATKNFYAKFVKGDLQYFVAAGSFQDFMYEYQVTNRQVWEQNLILNDIQKQQLFEDINKAVFSDDKFYTYKFIDKNCTTMVLDKINNIFGKKVVTKKTNNNVSYRAVLYSFLNNHFWENFGINIIFGSKVDKNAEKLFLPEELMSNLETSKFKNKRISEKAVVLNNKKTETTKFSFWNSIYPYCIFLLSIVLINKKSVSKLYFSLIGLIGIFFSTVGFYSLHEEIYWNYNVLLFNPSLLILVYFMVKTNVKYIKIFGLFNLFCLLIYVVFLINKAHLLIMIPMIVASAIIIFRLVFLNKTLQTAIK